MDPGHGSEGESMAPQAFEELVKEGKAERKERAERKRQENLRRIENMNSKTGIDPVELFPKEIWKMISQFSDPDGRGNLCRIHPLFADLMEDTKVDNILLPKVLRLEYFVNQIAISRKKAQKLLHLRCVSKSLRDAVDSVIQSHILKTIQDDVDQDSEILTIAFGQRTRNFADLVDMEQFVGRNGMKFVLNSFGFEFWTIRPHLEYFEDVSNKVLSLLEIVGKQLLHFDYSFTIYRFYDEHDRPIRNRNPSQLCYIFFQKCVSLMPNLKWLKVHQNPSFTVEGFISEMLETTELRAAVDLHPFPRLEHLKKISIELFSCNDQEDVFSMAILEANSHVRNLMVQSHTYWYHDNRIEGERERRPRIQPTQSLKPLDLAALAIRNDIQLGVGQNEIDLLRGMMNPSWPLTRLHFGVYMHYESINVLFRLLENFPTLAHLNLLVEFVNLFDECTTLRLPNLVEFEITFRKLGVKMDKSLPLHHILAFLFLAESKKLKRLAWICNDWPMDYNEDGERFWELLRNDPPSHLRDGLLNVWKEERDLKESNIWKMFSYLEYVSISCRHDCRETWDYFRECYRPIY